MRTTFIASCLMFVLGLSIGGSLTAGSEAQSSSSDASGELVTGIGGVFFKARNAAKLRAWYNRHLGIDTRKQGTNFFWRENDDASLGMTVWSVFPRDTKYFGGDQRLMINYRVRDLDRLLSKLRSEGVQQVGGIQELWYGRFAWVLDGEGNRIELWQPVRYSPERFMQEMKKRETAPDTI